jgi:uncharacterized delta-60 repeat protein
LLFASDFCFAQNSNLNFTQTRCNSPGAYVQVAQSAAIQSDGKVVIVGGYFTVARFNLDGTLDSLFGINGIVDTIFGNVGTVRSVIIQNDGKIVMAGSLYSKLAVVRCNIDGSLDNSFGTDGKVSSSIGSYHTIDGYSAAIQQDGKIVVVGSAYDGTHRDFAIVRYNSNGTQDNNFGSGGVLATSMAADDDYAKSVAIQEDGKIIAAGLAQYPNSAAPEIALVRYNIDGTLDNSFSGDGMLTTSINSSSQATGVAIQTDGKIVIVGSENSNSSPTFTVVRYNSNGDFDTTFNGNGKVYTHIGVESNATSIVIQPDGKIVAAGLVGYTGLGHDFALVRYKINGMRDSTFGSNGIVITDFEYHPNYAFAVDYHDGKIIASGGTDNGIIYKAMVARYLSNLNTGVVDFSISKNNVLIYPNPIANSTTLEYTLKNSENITIQIVDIEGRLIKTFIQTDLQQSGEHQQKIEMPDGLSGGVYFIVISSPNGKVSVKILK